MTTGHWHILTGVAPLLALLAVLWPLGRWLLRPPRLAAGAGQPDGPPAPLPRWPLRAVAALYAAGSATGVVMMLRLWFNAQLNGPLALVLTLMTLPPLLALYGAWQAWRGQARGVRTLYWLSWLCVPVWVSPVVSYYNGLGLALLLVTSWFREESKTGLTMNLHAQVGYIAHLSWMQPDAVPTLGLNVLALALALWLAHMLRGPRRGQDGQSAAPRESQSPQG